MYGFNHEPVWLMLHDLNMQLKIEVFDIKSSNKCHFFAPILRVF